MTSMWAETINSQLKRILLFAATRKNETKLRKAEKTWKKKITPMKVTLLKIR